MKEPTLFLIFSQAEVNTYQDLYPHLDNFDNYYFIDCTAYNSYKVKYDRLCKVIVLKNRWNKKNNNFFYKILLLIQFRAKFIKYCQTYKIKNVVMGSDKEPINLLIINYCTKNNIRTTIFQHGLYIPETEDYELASYHNRFSSLGYYFYNILRKLFSKTNLFPYRYPIGQNGASQYFFYSNYYRDMFKTSENEYKLRIVGPTKYAKLQNDLLDEKTNIIVYASCLIKKWYPEFSIDDEEIFRKLFKILPNDYLFIIKPHPSETSSDYEKVLKDVQGRYTLLKPDDDIEKYLPQSKLFISFVTSVIFDAIYFENIVLLLDLMDGRYVGSLKELNQISFETLDTLNVENIITNKKHIIEKQKTFLIKHLGNKLEENPEKFINYLYKE